MLVTPPSRCTLVACLSRCTVQCHLVFEGPVTRTGKRPDLNRTLTGKDRNFSRPEKTATAVLPVDEGLLRKLSTPMGTNPPIWNELKSCFRQPPIDFGEAAVCKWLNNIGMTMGLIYGRQCDRLWWSGRCRMPLVSSSVHRAPDLILLDRIYYNRSTETDFSGIEWAFVKALAGVHQ
jgi:hypothetical protein